MEQDTIYHFHPLTKIFMGESPLELDPIDNEPLIPANATLKAVISVALNEVAVWNGSAWSAVADYRGHSGFDVNGIEQSIVEIGIEPDPTWTDSPPFVLSDAIAIKKSEIEGEADVALSSITNQYSRIEIDSWPTQEAEANAWTADNNSATPLLDNMVANRPGMDKPTLVGKILTNAVQFKSFSGVVIGKKQGYEDAVSALTTGKTQSQIDALTQADLDAIMVTF